MDAIYRDLHAQYLGPARARRLAATDPHLSDGFPGAALFLSYYDRLDRASTDAMAERFALSQATALRATPSPGLFAGLSGVLWASDHLGLEGAAEIRGHPFYGKALHRNLASPHRADAASWEGLYDLVGGLVGIGLAEASAVPSIITRLERIARAGRGGCSWFTPRARVPGVSACFPPGGGYTNLGVAHGMPGILLFLAWAHRRGYSRSACRRLATGAVSWLLRAEEGWEGEGFPHWVSRRGRIGRRRLAWCYGDPGVGAALYQAGESFGEPGWRADARRILRRAIALPRPEAGVRDASLCHGAAGLGHLYNRLYQSSGWEELREESLFWFRRTLDLRRPELGFGGFRRLSTASHRSPGRELARPRLQADPGFLTGSAGTGLALLAALRGVEPSWDQVLLLSEPAWKA